jgi:hypothetical protein
MVSSSRPYIFRGFNSKSSNIILKALSFSKSKIEEYRTQKKIAVDKTHHDVIDKEFDQLVKSIETVENFITEDVRRTRFLHKEHHEAIMDIIRSALEIYLRDTLEAKAKSGLDAFDRKIAEIREIIGFALFKGRKTDLFEEYFEAGVTSSQGKKGEVFFSYSHKDRVLAGKIATLLIEKGIDVFLAHEDIEISEEWREEIFKHLESDSVLLALLTPNYEKSVWANQEAGFMHGKRGKVIPLIVRRTEIKKCGFLEALQGIAIKEENLDASLEEILQAIFR